MHKGSKKVHEQSIPERFDLHHSIKVPTRTKSPQHMDAAEKSKKLKIKTGKQGSKVKEKRDLQLNLGGTGQLPSKDCGQKGSLYEDLYKNDLKHHEEYLESCQKAGSAGINMKWPYCFDEDSLI